VFDMDDQLQQVQAAARGLQASLDALDADVQRDVAVAVAAAARDTQAAAEQAQAGLKSLEGSVDTRMAKAASDLAAAIATAAADTQSVRDNVASASAASAAARGDLDSSLRTTISQDLSMTAANAQKSVDSLSAALTGTISSGLKATADAATTDTQSVRASVTNLQNTMTASLAQAATIDKDARTALQSSLTQQIQATTVILRNELAAAVNTINSNVAATYATKATVSNVDAALTSFKGLAATKAQLDAEVSLSI